MAREKVLHHQIRNQNKQEEILRRERITLTEKLNKLKDPMYLSDLYTGIEQQEIYLKSLDKEINAIQRQQGKTDAQITKIQQPSNQNDMNNDYEVHQEKFLVVCKDLAAQEERFKKQQDDIIEFELKQSKLEQKHRKFMKKKARIEPTLEKAKRAGDFVSQQAVLDRDLKILSKA